STRTSPVTPAVILIHHSLSQSSTLPVTVECSRDSWLVTRRRSWNIHTYFARLRKASPSWPFHLHSRASQCPPMHPRQPLPLANVQPRPSASRNNNKKKKKQTKTCETKLRPPSACQPRRPSASRAQQQQQQHAASSSSLVPKRQRARWRPRRREGAKGERKACLGQGKKMRFGSRRS
ncbi:hypothetical protein IE81DRAFT_354327, partial [Ceraceosorus guamensis]